MIIPKGQRNFLPPVICQGRTSFNWIVKYPVYVLARTGPRVSGFELSVGFKRNQCQCWFKMDYAHSKEPDSPFSSTCD